MSSNLISLYLNAVSKCVNACALHLGVRLNRQTASLQYNRSSRRHCTTNTHTFLTCSLETKPETLRSRSGAWLRVCVSICLLCFSHLWMWIMCLCMCVCVWRPVETVITATGWSLSETACCSSSCHYHSSTSSPPATTVWGLSSAIFALSFFCSYIFCFFLFLSLTAELNELVSCRAREWRRLACASQAESELKSTADTLSVSGITSQQSTFEKYQENLTGTSQPL